ncbi:TPM domain-containing protein [Paraburkholderia sp. J94]|uniref:TPM domain-containing protein n=1 Tax=Paraburkholderia sp. J94 TaxID=2805441 RepID=UPI002AB1A0E4|nr:TPM domain-containing protein [Paraburkholderia sp. J94]
MQTGAKSLSSDRLGSERSRGQGVMIRLGWLAALLICVAAHAGSNEGGSGVGSSAAADGDTSVVASADAGTGACTQAYAAPLVDTVLSADSIPHPQGRVTDLTSALSSACTADLTRRLAALEQQTGDQLAVLLVPSTGDVSIEQYATQIFEQWKLGQKKADNGILLVAALHDHHVRIEVGYGLEGTVPDVIAGRIIRERIVPAFRDNKFEAGISAAVDSLTQRLTDPVQTGASTPDETADESAASSMANSADSAHSNDSVDPATATARTPPMLAPPSRYDGPLLWFGLAFANLLLGVVGGRVYKTRRAQAKADAEAASRDREPNDQAGKNATNNIGKETNNGGRQRRRRRGFELDFPIWPLVSGFVATMLFLIVWLPPRSDDLSLLPMLGACVGFVPCALGIGLYLSRRVRKWSAIFAAIYAVVTGFVCATGVGFVHALGTAAVVVLLGSMAIIWIAAKIMGVDTSSNSSSSWSWFGKRSRSSNDDSGWGGGGGSSGGGGASGNW